MVRNDLSLAGRLLRADREGHHAHLHGHHQLLHGGGPLVEDPGDDSDDNIRSLPSLVF